MATAIATNRKNVSETRQYASEPNVNAYVRGVLSGEIVTCKYVFQAVQRHVRDLEIGCERGLWFDEEDAALHLQFTRMLRHSKGEWAGQPLLDEPWQAFIEWSIFGWKKADGTRRYNTAFISVARKNGKSTRGAAVGIKLTVADGEPAAEVYSAATKRDQAKIVHNEAKRMVRKSPCLASSVTTLRDVLYVPATESIYQPLGADADSTDGLNLSGAIIDEVHAHKTRDLWDVLETATGSRRNPLMFAITTAGDSGDNESIYAELKEWTIKVLSGAVEDDSWFGIIYTLDGERIENGEKIPADDWADESVWIKANPNLGVSVKLDDLRRKCRKAKQTPDAVANFRRKHCNQETTRSHPWMPTDDGTPWHKCSGGDFYDKNGITADPIKQWHGREVFVGCDLSSISDLTAMAFASKADDDIVEVLAQAWCPKDNAVGRDRDKRVPYMTWADEGFIKLTGGNSVDYNELRAFLRRARDEWGWDIQEIACDPSNARHFITELMEEDGFGHVIEHLQTTDKMNDPIGLSEKLILDGQLRHGGHKVLRWCVSNAITYKDTGGRRRFDKKAIREKIDLAVATVMAVGRLMLTIDTSSAYEDHGVMYADEIGIELNNDELEEVYV